MKKLFARIKLGIYKRLAIKFGEKRIFSNSTWYSLTVGRYWLIYHFDELIEAATVHRSGVPLDLVKKAIRKNE